MKLFSIITISLLLVATGCDGYLDKAPSLSLSEADIYSSPERIESAVRGIYSKMKQTAFIGGKTYVFIENIGDDMKNVSGNVSNEGLESYEMSVGLNSTDNSLTWSTGYQVINNINTALAALEKSSQVAGDNYNRYRQELGFLRALSYYYLNALFALPYAIRPDAPSVPLRLQAESSIAGNELAQATNTEVYRQILSDTESYGSLPATGGTYESITRASQAAVLLLRQRVFMALGRWQDAIDAGLAIRGYRLESEALAPFRSSESCAESIFSFPMTSVDYGGGHQQSVPYFFGNGKSLVLDRTSGIHSPLYPAYNLEADQRVSLLIVPKLGQEIVAKYTDDTNYLDWIVLMRYAEVKLNLAESYAEIGQEEKAREALLEVRRRSLAAMDDPIDISSLSGSALQEAIRLERRAEFVGEAIRAIDIKRRGEDFVKQKGTSTQWTVTPQDEGYTWPIPAAERINNPAIQ